jgi:carboxymethylenebutenolidase
MGETIEFTAADGRTVGGYLARGPEGSPGVVVIQEWWGVNAQIEGVCDRLSDAGFNALAPDLYNGTVVPLEEPDGAAKEMMSLQLAHAGADLSGAVDVLATLSGRDAVGVLGFCMGGGLALVLGDLRPDAIKAVVPCYGVHPWPEAHPSYESYSAATQIHCAAKDGFFTPEAAQALRDKLLSRGLEVDLLVYPDSDHAFFNEDRADVYNAADAALLWERTVTFLASHLG